jgi:acid stress-induced BolA-like protein IbaG/YrbA
VDVLKKVKTALNRHFKPELLDLHDDDGIVGVIVSDDFRGVESIDRQTMIQQALQKSTTPLTKADWRRILIIAPMTPEEFVAYAPRNAHKSN